MKTGSADINRANHIKVGGIKHGPVLTEFVVGFPFFWEVEPYQLNMFGVSHT